MFKPSSLLSVLIVASLFFVFDALMMNVVFLSLLAGIVQAVVGLPLLFRDQGLALLGLIGGL